MPEPDELSPLADQECPLLGGTPDILDRFRRLCEVFRQLAADTRVFRAKDVQKAAEALLEIRDRLRRPRYQVGFLGTTQAAKSSTILSLFERKKGEGPVDPGDGPPKTSSITRIICQAAGENLVEVRYVTPEQYAEKRAKLCEATGLDPASSDDTLLKQLGQLLDGLPAANGKTENPPMIRDLLTLGKLLRSYSHHRNLVTNPPTTLRNQPYSSREKFVNHPPEVPGQRFAPSSNHLIREVEIRLTTDKVPLRLEMIDLPGLGSDGISDNILTKGFLHELDGAMVFLKSDQYGDANVEHILGRLAQEFQGGKTRTWIIATKMDVPEQHALYGGTAEGLAGFLLKHNLSPEQMVLTCNRLYDRRGSDGKVPLSVAAGVIQVRAEEPVPGPFAAVPGLREAFEELLLNGGIGRLRRIATTELEKRVSADTQRAIRERLGRISQELVQTIEFHRQVSSGNIDLLVLAEECRNAITREITALDTRMDQFVAPATEVHRELEAILDKIFPATEDNVRFGRTDLARRFPVHAKILQGTMTAAIHERLIKPAYDALAERLKRPEFDKVPVGDTLGLWKYWESIATADTKLDAVWRKTGFPTFQADLATLFTPPPDGEEEVGKFNGEDYRDMLGEKNRTAIGQVVHRLRAQVRRQLYDLRDRLNQLDDYGPQELTGPSTLDYDALLAELRDLCLSQ